MTSGRLQSPWSSPCNVRRVGRSLATLGMLRAAKELSEIAREHDDVRDQHRRETTGVDGQEYAASSAVGSTGSGGPCSGGAAIVDFPVEQGRRRSTGG